MIYSAEQLAQASKLGTSTLFEASGIPTSFADIAIRTVWAGASVAGPAYPLECSPGDNLAIHIAMEKVPRGSILVISTGGFVAGYWGEVLTVAAEAAGVAGLIIDGGVRDIAALTARRFPVFSRGISMRGTIKASSPSVGRPISFTGTPVATGDLVVADDAKVVVGHEGEGPPPLPRPAVEHDRSGLRDTERAGGQHAVARVEPIVGEPRVAEQLETRRQPFRGQAVRHGQPLHSPGGARRCDRRGQVAGRDPPDHRLVLGDSLDELSDPLGARGGVGPEVVARDRHVRGRFGRGYVAERVPDSPQDLVACGAHERVLHHSRKVCGAIGKMSRIVVQAPSGPGARSMTPSRTNGR